MQRCSRAASTRASSRASPAGTSSARRCRWLCLGRPIDIHTGGEDNIFPHHECEIAQSYGASAAVPSRLGVEPGERRRFARFWVHGRHLLVDRRKMSKRDGTFFTVRDLLDPAGNGPRLAASKRWASPAHGSGAVLRYALISNPYTQPMNFTFDLLVQAKASLERLQSLLRQASRDGCLQRRGVDASAEVVALVDRHDENFRKRSTTTSTRRTRSRRSSAPITGLNQMSLERSFGTQAIELVECSDAVLDVLNRRVLSGVVTFEEIADASLPSSSEILAEANLNVRSAFNRAFELRHAAKKARNFDDARTRSANGAAGHAVCASRT